MVEWQFLWWIFYWDIAGFSNDCPWADLCSGLTAWILYISQQFRNIVVYDSWSVSSTKFYVTFLLLTQKFTYALLITLNVPMLYFCCSLYVHLSSILFTTPFDPCTPFTMQLLRALRQCRRASGHSGARRSGAQLSGQVPLAPLSLILGQKTINIDLKILEMYFSLFQSCYQ